jgi:hypothetical protein
VLIRRGDPLFRDAPAWSLSAQSGEAQSRQFGFANDAAWADAFEREHRRPPGARDRADRQWSLDFLKRTGRPPALDDWAARAEPSG